MCSSPLSSLLGPSHIDLLVWGPYLTMRGLLPALHSEISPGRIGGAHEVPDWHGLAACKASALLTDVLLLYL